MRWCRWLQVAAEAVRALMQLRCLDSQPPSALELLQAQLPRLAQLRAPLALVQSLWLTLLAGAAAVGDAGLSAQARRGQVSQLAALDLSSLQ